MQEDEEHEVEHELQGLGSDDLPGFDFEPQQRDDARRQEDGRRESGMTLATPPSSPIEVNDERPRRGEDEVCCVFICSQLSFSFSLHFLFPSSSLSYKKYMYRIRLTHRL